MAFQPGGDVIGYRTQFTMNGKPAEMTFYGHTEGTPSLADVQAGCEAIDAVVAEGWLTNLPTSTRYVRTYGRSLATESAPEFFTTASAGDGTATGEPSPNNVTFCVQRTSGLTGRSRRGRVYWPGLSGDMLETPNFLFESNAADIVNAIRLITPALLDAAQEDVILSRVQDGVILPVAAHYSVVAYQARDLRADTQRRRIVGATN